MSTDETYNGYSNRETWAVALHINNDQGWQESVHEALRFAAEEYRDPDCGACEDGESHPVSQYPAYLAGDIIRENVESLFGDLEAMSFEDSSGALSVSREYLSMREDIGSLWRLSWDELGAAFLADVAEENGPFGVQAAPLLSV